MNTELQEAINRILYLWAKGLWNDFPGDDMDQAMSALRALASQAQGDSQ